MLDATKRVASSGSPPRGRREHVHSLDDLSCRRLISAYGEAIYTNGIYAGFGPSPHFGECARGTKTLSQEVAHLCICREANLSVPGDAAQSEHLFGREQNGSVVINGNEVGGSLRTRRGPQNRIVADPIPRLTSACTERTRCTAQGDKVQRLISAYVERTCRCLQRCSKCEADLRVRGENNHDGRFPLMDAG